MSSLIASLDSSPGTFSPAETSGKKFLNTVPTVVTRPGSTLRMMRRMMTEKRYGDPAQTLGPFHTDATIYARPPASGLRVTWMGHSSLLLEIDGVRILTDPVWSERASLVSFAGPKRFYAPSLSLDDLPPLDAVLLSHDHYDHLDRATIQQLQAVHAASGLRFICSLGIGAHLESWGIARQQITELNWGRSTTLGHQFANRRAGNLRPGSRNSITGAGVCHITATPARHFSGRGLWSRNETLWSSFVIRSGRHNIFFGGDSGDTPDFHRIGDAFGPFDLTMLEIGAYDDDWPDVHMGPDKATEAHQALQGKLLLPIHWGLFNLAFHRWQEPVVRLTGLAEWKDISLLLPKPGTPTEVTGGSLNTFWWEA
jgi:L-ascorbate metabolism protein UlaG (beta-lactamase superfamily)